MFLKYFLKLYIFKRFILKEIIYKRFIPKAKNLILEVSMSLSITVFSMARIAISDFAEETWIKIRYSQTLLKKYQRSHFLLWRWIRLRK